ncbi:MAG: TetR family transcriptional regulator [Acidimicrobiia bacterium]|nr:TetR family transcriptional regulator [Acidimicrobiia bacterium]
MANQDIGLRERKRMAAIWRIQEIALDLFDEYGFENVTVEQIAAAAEVSPSSVYRYFGGKQQIVLQDEFEVELIDAVEEQLQFHPPVEAVRRAISGIMTEFFDRDEGVSRRRTRYTLEEPALRAAELKQTDEFAQVVAQALARASDREEVGLEDRVISSAIVWALMAAVRHWHENGYRSSLRDAMERALTMVERGLG